jgi:hypothetical protein
VLEARLVKKKTKIIGKWLKTLKRNKLRGNEIRIGRIAPKGPVKENNMNKNKLIMLALVGAGLVAASQAHAQSDMNYNDNDLLLNFRNSSTGAGSDAEIDLGNVNTFVSTVAGLPGEFAVLDSGTGYTTPTAGYTPTFTGAGVIGAVSSTSDATSIGFSASAENLGATPGTAAHETLWLTRVISAGQTSTGGTASFQSTPSAQINTANDIQNVGFEAESPANLGTGTALTGAGNGGVVSDTDPLSYHTLGRASVNSTTVISYGGNVTGTGTSPLEATPALGAPIYEALWEVPPSGSGSDTYEGYFTFNSNGEVDFTEVSAVPEPSTYSLFAATGLLALALRRQFRSLNA